MDLVKGKTYHVTGTTSAGKELDFYGEYKGRDYGNGMKGFYHAFDTKDGRKTFRPADTIKIEESHPYSTRSKGSAGGTRKNRKASRKNRKASRKNRKSTRRNRRH
jgi:hypothetical protein